MGLELLVAAPLSLSLLPPLSNLYIYIFDVIDRAVDCGFLSVDCQVLESWKIVKIFDIKRMMSLILTRTKLKERQEPGEKRR